jgi:hypothetical protein
MSFHVRFSDLDFQLVIVLREFHNDDDDDDDDDDDRNTLCSKFRVASGTNFKIST